MTNFVSHETTTVKREDAQNEKVNFSRHICLFFFAFKVDDRSCERHNLTFNYVDIQVLMLSKNVPNAIVLKPLLMLLIVIIIISQLQTVRIVISRINTFRKFMFVEIEQN